MKTPHGSTSSTWLLYFMGRYRKGCAVLEGALALYLKQMKGRSYEILCSVYNEDDEPTNRCRVTLSHFYRRLGTPLTRWRDWNAFVTNLHPKLFRVAAISRDQLLADAAQLPVFFDRLREVLDERLTTSTTDGQSDLIDSAAAVKRRQERRQRELDDFDVRIAPVRERTDQKLGELFPELTELLPRRSAAHSPSTKTSDAPPGSAGRPAQ